MHRAQKILCPGNAKSRCEGRGSRNARRQKCARAHSLAERSTANPEIPQQETPYAFQKAEIRFRFRLGEAYSALRGWRPIPAALLSHSVVLCSGTEDIPSNYTYRVTNIPDKQRSIRKTP